MNENEQEIRDIIDEFKKLRLQQDELINRLERLDSNPPANPQATRATGTPRPTAPPEREFAVGDRVRIRNPGPFQSSFGTIEKIGAARITVRDRDGRAIVRIPKNIIPNNV